MRNAEEPQGPRVGHPLPRGERHLRQPVRDLLDAHGAGIDAEVMRIWITPEAREAGRRYVEQRLGKRP